MPDAAEACYVMAHGAGAGMSHPFMEAVAIELAAHRIATLRYQFPYMERGAKRPDTPAVAQAAVR
ncbi:MAG: alpha/beta hydrolase, partial [Burkholderiales bacterium]|nr:alpha/beta hydrolase [Burkholderiales bacterium]